MTFRIYGHFGAVLHFVKTQTWQGDGVRGGPMDAVDARILAILQDDGRISMRDLGAAVGLSGPAVAERVRRLEESGIVRGYRAVVAPARLGWQIGAFISVALPDGRTPHEFEAYAAEAPEILECHRITGDDCYLLRVALPDIATLETVLERIKRYGRTRTSILLSSPVEGKRLLPTDGVESGSPTPPLSVGARRNGRRGAKAPAKS